MQVCIELWPSTFSENAYFVLANLILCYLAPLSVITFCYIIIWRSVANRNIPGEYLGYKSTRDTINKSRLKVTKMVFVVIITFALSWLPLYSIFCIVKFRDDILYDDQGQGDILEINKTFSTIQNDIMREVQINNDDLLLFSPFISHHHYSPRFYLFLGSNSSMVRMNTKSLLSESFKIFMLLFLLFFSQAGRI